MKVGKVPENVLKRSVFKQIHTMRPEVVLGAGVGEDCAAVQLAEDETLVMSTDPITGTAKDIGTLAIQITVNDLASAGGGTSRSTSYGTFANFCLRTGSVPDDEAGGGSLRKSKCAGHGRTYRGYKSGKPAGHQCLWSRKSEKGHLISTAGARPGMDILVSKWIGIEGTSIIAKEKEEELKTHFAVPFIEHAKALDAYISVQSEAAVAVTSGVSAMHDVTEGGIFGALWKWQKHLASDLKST